MSKRYLNTFGVISFRLGNESSTVKYERYVHDANLIPVNLQSASPPQPDLLIEERYDSQCEKVFWIIEEDGQLIVEEYCITTLVEQIDSQVKMGPYQSRYAAEQALALIRSVVTSNEQQLGVE